jgi:ribosome-binding protein aMBF1 (putative translation factor)
MSLDQQWEPVILRKALPRVNTSANPPKALTALDAPEVEAPKLLGLEAAKQIQTARCSRKLTQAQLAQLVNEKANLIKDYETGKVVANRSVLNKLNRCLGIKIVT